MKKYLLVCFLAISGSGSFASTVQSVNLSLRVDEAKYNGVTVEEFNDNQEILRTSYFSSLSLIDAKKYNPPTPSFQFSVGQMISFSAIFPNPNEQIEDCTFGGISCSGAFGSLSSDRLDLSDGTGEPELADFSFQSGLQLGDTARLLTIIPQRFTFADDPENSVLVEWNSFEHQFTVTQVPLPASSFLLLGSVGILWLAKRSSSRPRKTRMSIA